MNTRKFNRWSLAGAGLFAACALAAPAHHHGLGRIEVVQEADSLTILLTSPLDALAGFERVPRSEPERRALQAMSQTLRDGDRMFALSKDAGCVLADVALESPVLAGQPIEGGHADLSAHYRFRCSRMAALREMRLGLFQAFPRLKKIELQFAGPTGQRAAALSAKNPRFAW